MNRTDAPQPNRRDRAAHLAGCFEADYALYQYCFVEFFLEHLSDVSRAFGGDLQQMLVLGLIGQVRLNAARRAIAAGEDPRGLDPCGTTISASRLADASGIARETVRRKLARLQEQGWIDRTEAGGWYLVFDPDTGESAARRGFEALDRRARLRVARLVADLEAVADSGRV